MPKSSAYRVFAIFALVATAASPWGSVRSEGYFDRHAEGWFWYRDPPAPPEPKEPPPPSPPEAPPPPPVKIEAPPSVSPPPPPFGSAAWLRENMPRFRDRAIDDPNPDNVRAYYVVQRLALDKASAFTDMAQRVVIGDPLLDETMRRPTATAGANKMNAVAGEATDAQLKAIAGTAGIWFFFRSDCPYCSQQAPILKMLERAYGFDVVAISLDGGALPGNDFPNFKRDDGHAAQLGVERTPTIYLVRPPDGFQQIAGGMVSLQDLRRRILTASLNAGWIDQKAFDATRAVEPGPMLPAKIDAPVETTDDPVKFVEYLRSKVRN